MRALAILCCGKTDSEVPNSRGTVFTWMCKRSVINGHLTGGAL